MSFLSVSLCFLVILVASSFSHTWQGEGVSQSRLVLLWSTLLPLILWCYCISTMQWDFCLSYWFWFFLWKIDSTSLHKRGRLKDLSRIRCTYGNHENVPRRLGTKGAVMEDGLLFAVLNRNSLPHWAESTLPVGCSRLVTERGRDTKARVFLESVVHVQWLTSVQEVLDGLAKHLT